MQEQSLNYAGFWVRVGATLIDTLLIISVTFPMLIAVYGWKYFSTENTSFLAGPADFLISYIFPAMAVIVFWYFKSATPGKILLSIKIIDAKTGGKPSLWRFIGRYFAYFVSMLPLGLGFLWVAFDKKKQGWHDKLAGTILVKDTSV